MSRDGVEADVRESIVLKIGGDLAADAVQLAALAKDARALVQRGYGVVVVHGGGPQATALSRRLGLEPHMVGGRRVTDAATLEVMKMILGGVVSVDLSAALSAAGLGAVGVSGVSAGLITAAKRPPRVVSGGGDAPVDFGYVGDIVRVETGVLEALTRAGFVPVVNSLGADGSGQVYNINADIAATRVAQALGARLVLTTGGVRGVLRDRNDASSRIATLTAAQARQAIADGAIQGGMIPKLEESLEVLEAGVSAVHILGQLEPGDLLAEIEHPGSVGTALTRS